MNLFQSITSALDICLQKDPTAGKVCLIQSSGDSLFSVHKGVWNTCTIFDA